MNFRGCSLHSFFMFKNGKTTMLNIEKKAMSAAGTTAHEADVLLGKGKPSLINWKVKYHI